YKLNFSKSECFPVNDLALQIPDRLIPFKIEKPKPGRRAINWTVYVDLTCRTQGHTIVIHSAQSSRGMGGRPGGGGQICAEQWNRTTHTSLTV
ncbi:hypothetical protein NQZ68_006257, partial [Dissostichus eleginoides]